MKKKISVIGCGWLGLPIAKRLINKGYKVKGSTTTKKKLSKLSSLGIQPFEFIVDNEVKSLNEDLFDCDICYIIIPPNRKQPFLYLNIIKAILRNIKKETDVFYTSTTGVYKNNNDWVDEDSELGPIKETSKVVLEAENLIRTWGLNRYTIFRLAGLVGENRKAGRFLAGRKEIQGGLNPVNLVHLIDCVNILTHNTFLDGSDSDIYNICSLEHPLKQDLYPHLSVKLGIEAPTFSNEETIFKKVSSNKVLSHTLYSMVYGSPFLFD